MEHIGEDVGPRGVLDTCGHTPETSPVPSGRPLADPSRQTDPDLVPCAGCGNPKNPAFVCKILGCSTRGIRPGFDIKPPEGVALASAGAPPANEIIADIPVVVIRFKRGRAIFENPIDTLVALEDAPNKMQTGTAGEQAGLLREALTSTAKIEFEKDRLGVDGAVVVADVEDEPNQLTFTETRAISDALVEWSKTLGKS